MFKYKIIFCRALFRLKILANGFLNEPLVAAIVFDTAEHWRFEVSDWKQDVQVTNEIREAVTNKVGVNIDLFLSSLCSQLCGRLGILLPRLDRNPFLKFFEKLVLKVSH